MFQFLSKEIFQLKFLNVCLKIWLFITRINIVISAHESWNLQKKILNFCPKILNFASKNFDECPKLPILYLKISQFLTTNLTFYTHSMILGLVILSWIPKENKSHRAFLSVFLFFVAWPIFCHRDKNLVTMTKNWSRWQLELSRDQFLSLWQKFGHDDNSNCHRDQKLVTMTIGIAGIACTLIKPPSSSSMLEHW